jgi:ABC-type arginine/histidine transport system permease subunit
MSHDTTSIYHAIADVLLRLTILSILLGGILILLLYLTKRAKEKGNKIAIRIFIIGLIIFFLGFVIASKGLNYFFD